MNMYPLSSEDIVALRAVLVTALADMCAAAVAVDISFEIMT